MGIRLDKEEETAGVTAVPLHGTLTKRVSSLLAFVSQHHFVILLAVASFSMRLLWAAVIPLWQAPDEPAHFAYVQSLGENVSLTPSQYMSQDTAIVRNITRVGAIPFHPETTQPFSVGSYDGPGEDAIDEIPDSARSTPNIPEKNSAAPYPPGYYLLASFVYRLVASQDTLTIVFVLRIFSAVLSTATILITYWTLRRFFSDAAAARAGVLIIALSPMYAFMGMAINPEVLIWLLFILLLYLMIRSLDEGLSLRANLLIALVIAAGLWTKQTFLVAVPIYAVFLGFAYFRRLITLRRAAQYAGFAALLIVALVGWYYLGGFIETAPDVQGQPQPRSISGFLRHFDQYWPFYYWTYDTFWGIYGWLDTPVSQRIFGFTRWGSALAAAALGIRFLVSAAMCRVDVKALFFLSVSVIFIAAFLVVNYLLITRGEIFPLQGRYFFPIIGPVISLMLLGALTLVPSGRIRNYALLAIVFAMVVFHVDSLVRFVIPRYYF